MSWGPPLQTRLYLRNLDAKADGSGGGAADDDDDGELPERQAALYARLAEPRPARKRTKVATGRDAEQAEQRAREERDSRLDDLRMAEPLDDKSFFVRQANEVLQAKKVAKDPNFGPAYPPAPVYRALLTKYRQQPAKGWPVDWQSGSSASSSTDTGDTAGGGGDAAAPSLRRNSRR